MPWGSQQYLGGRNFKDVDYRRNVYKAQRDGERTSNSTGLHRSAAQVTNTYRGKSLLLLMVYGLLGEPDETHGAMRDQLAHGIMGGRA